MVGPEGHIHRWTAPRKNSFSEPINFNASTKSLVDAFVYAHNHHRRNMDNPGNIGGCMKGTIRFMTAITPAYAQTYQLIYLTRRILVVPREKFRLPAAKARYPHLPNSRTTTRERGNDFQGWAIYVTGIFALLMVKHLTDGVLSHDHTMEG